MFRKLKLALLLFLLSTPGYAQTKLSQINNGGAINTSTDKVVAVRSGTADELLDLSGFGQLSNNNIWTGTNDFSATLTVGDTIDSLLYAGEAIDTNNQYLLLASGDVAVDFSGITNNGAIGFDYNGVNIYLNGSPNIMPGIGIVDSNGQLGRVGQVFVTDGLSNDTWGYAGIAGGGTNATSFTNTELVYYNGTSLVSTPNLVYTTTPSAGNPYFTSKTSAAADPAQVVQMAASQTADPWQLWTSAGAFLSGFQPDGTLTLNYSSSYGGGITVGGNTNNGTTIMGAGTSVGAIQAMAFGIQAYAGQQYDLAFGPYSICNSGAGISFGGYVTGSAAMAFGQNSSNPNNFSLIIGNNGTTYNAGNFNFETNFSAPDFSMSYYDGSFNHKQVADIKGSYISNVDATYTGRLQIGAVDYNGFREGMRVDSNGSVPLLGFYGGTAVAEPATTGTTTGYTANSSVNILYAGSTFTGGTGSAAYTVGDIVLALKQLNLLTN